MTTERRNATEQIEIDKLYEDVREAAQEVGDFIGEQMKERPYATLAAAAAVGYALGVPRGALGVLLALSSRMTLRWLESLFEAPPARAKQRRSTR